MISHILLFCLIFQTSVLFNDDSASVHVQLDTSTYVSEKKTSHRMNVFVHGTILPVPSFGAFKNVVSHVAKNGVNNFEKLYQECLDERRGGKSLYSYQPIGKKGLIKIENYAAADYEACGYTHSSKLLSDIFTKAITSQDGMQESCSCYVFGWDGRLEHANRVEWAKRLYQELSDEIKKVRQHCGADEVELDIFAHSHGGNVALNMVRFHKELSEKLSINRLVMLGTPVQVETEKYVLDPLFKSVYLVYSQGDAIQVLDSISTTKLSKRRFEGKAEKNKVIHIEVEVDQKSLTHSELWSYGMVGKILYRKNLSIYPLPVVAFMPEILKSFHQELVPGATVQIGISRTMFEYPKAQPKDIIVLGLRKQDSKGIFAMCSTSTMIPLQYFPESNRALLPTRA